MRLSKYAQLHAPVLDAREDQGTVKPGPRRRSPRRPRRVHYSSGGRPPCLNGDGTGYDLSTKRKRVTCRRCLYWLEHIANRPTRPDRNPFELISGLAAAARDMTLERRAREHGPPRLMP